MKTNIFNETTETDINTQIIHFEVDGSQVQLEETEGGKKRAKIRFIQAGWNANGFFFQKSNLDEILQLMSNKPKIYLDHDYFGFGRSVKDWAASFEKTWKDDSSLMGEITFTDNPNTLWLYEEVKKDPKSVQFSIDVQAVVSDMEMPNKVVGKKVEKVVNYRSTDIVSYAAAGGEAIKILNEKVLEQINNINSFVKNHKETPDMEGVKLNNLADLKQHYPGLVTQIINEVKEQGEVAVKITGLETEVQELKNSVNDYKSQIETLKSEKTELEGKVETLTNEKSELEQKNQDLSTKVDEFETAKAVAEWEEKVQNAIKESEIDEKLVTDVFMATLKRENDIEKVKELIEDRKGLTVGIKNSGEQKPTKPAETEVTVSDDELVDAIKGQ